MANKKKDAPPETYLCYVCGKVISGDHIYIETRRRSKLHIHKECVAGSKKDG